ncbi:hypothetical protein [Rickettsia endosymbiont of Ixodes pacificus]|nr:hypothetical protein [Rickettsia endosymbiont of Ixodes pacificus]
MNGFIVIASGHCCVDQFHLCHPVVKPRDDIFRAVEKVIKRSRKELI